MCLQVRNDFHFLAGIQLDLQGDILGECMLPAAMEQDFMSRKDPLLQLVHISD